MAQRPATRSGSPPALSRRWRGWIGLAAACALGAAAAPAAAEAPGQSREVRDPYFGETLFQFYQDRYFTALTELMASQQFGRVAHHADEAEVLRGGLYLSYGLHEQAARIFTQLIEQGAPPPIRDRAWFYLAKIRYQRGLGAQAEASLARIAGTLPADLEEDRILLQSNLLMHRGDYDGAVRALEPLVKSEPASLYARYNLGVALVRGGAPERGIALLDEIGRAPAATEEARSLRDRANVALGFAALQRKDGAGARTYLERVRLSGMMADKALLGYGWAAEALDDPRAALVSWMELAGRDPGDSAVLEAKLAVPYALAQLGADGQALEHYAAAIVAYDAESSRLDESIAAIRAGKLLDGLMARNPGEEMGWFWNIDQLPDMRHGAHLVRVLANHEFQEGFKNYRDLLFLARNLRNWRDNLDIIGDMLANRRQAYAERLPGLRLQEHDAALARLDAQRDALGKEIAAVEAQGDGSALADARERALAQRLARAREVLARLQANADPADGAAEAARKDAADRLRRVQGALAWEQVQELPQRLWLTRKEWRQVQGGLDQAHGHEQALRRAQQEEPRRFDAFAARIQALQQRIAGLMPEVDRLIAAEREAVQELAVAELRSQQEDLQDYGNQARFAVAQIYDRAGNRAAAVRAGAEGGAAPGPAPGGTNAPPPQGGATADKSAGTGAAGSTAGSTGEKPREP